MKKYNHLINEKSPMKITVNNLDIELELRKESANALIKIIEEIKTNPEVVLTAPHTTPVKRLDDAYASKKCKCLL